MPHPARSRRRANLLRRLAAEAKSIPLHMRGMQKRVVAFNWNKSTQAAEPVLSDENEPGQLDRAEDAAKMRLAINEANGHNFPKYKSYVSSGTAELDGRTRTIQPLRNPIQRKLCGCYWCSGVSR